MKLIASTLTRGTLARQAGVNSETIRFYENRKLLPVPERNASGYRQYSPDSLRRIRFIKRAQALGFSLEEISELLQLRTDRKRSSRAVKRVAEEKLNVIDAKIRDLRRMRKLLGELVNACDGEGPRHACPILMAIQEEVS